MEEYRSTKIALSYLSWERSQVHRSTPIQREEAEGGRKKKKPQTIILGKTMGNNNNETLCKKSRTPPIQKASDYMHLSS